MRVLAQRWAATLALPRGGTALAAAPRFLSRPAASRYLIHRAAISARQPLAFRPFHHAAARYQQFAAAAPAVEQDDVAPNHELITFHDLADAGIIHEKIINTITQRMGFTEMTDVQRMTIRESVQDVDVVAQAKTGTGKTLGFLLPIVQRLVTQQPNLLDRSAIRDAHMQSTKAIIISPTRELAEQIAEEARRLVAGTGIAVQTATGGTQKASALHRMRREGCHLLVATPGRLMDLLSDRYSGVEVPELHTLVLDEADRLLEAGFWKDINEIMTYLPNPKEIPRQTMMFSATIPREVVQIVRDTLRPGFEFVQTVAADEVPTHERVPQNLMLTNGFENAMPALYELCAREVAAKERDPFRPPFKAIVFFNSTSEVQYGSDVFFNLNRGLGGRRGGFGQQRSLLDPARFYAIHGKLTQSARTRASDGFRHTESAILFSSDVSARGMDFPGVTHVIQMGMPSSRDTYIHRLGRTGRAGKGGEGWLIVPAWAERSVRQDLYDLPIQRVAPDADNALATASVDMSTEAELPTKVAEALQTVSTAVASVAAEVKNDVYRVGVSLALQSKSPQQYIDALNNLARYGWGMDRNPGVRVPPKLRGQMFGIQGIEVDYSPRNFDRDMDGGRSSRFGDRFNSRFDERRGGDAFDRSGYGQGDRPRTFPRREGLGMREFREQRGQRDTGFPRERRGRTPEDFPGPRPRVPPPQWE